VLQEKDPASALMARKKNKKPIAESESHQHNSSETATAAKLETRKNKELQPQTLQDDTSKLKHGNTAQDNDSLRPAKRARIKCNASSKSAPVILEHAGALKNQPLGGMASTKSNSLPQHLQHLGKTYDIMAMNIISSSGIQDKVTKLLHKLEVNLDSAKTGAKPPIVVITAKAGVASKMVSIVEIAKRVLKGRSLKLFQYSTVQKELQEVKKKGQRKPELKPSNEDAVEKDAGSREGDGDLVMGTAEDKDDEEEAFESMEGGSKRSIPMGHVPEEKKIRGIPLMTVYLSRISIKELKEVYGEQISLVTR